jgi:hypothetical protein
MFPPSLAVLLAVLGAAPAGGTTLSVAFDGLGRKR